MKISMAMTHLFLVSLLLFRPAFAQEEHEATHESRDHRYAIAGFIGSTHAGSEHEFTLGIEAGMNLSSQWSIGAAIERAERERDSTLLLVGVGWHPLGPGLRIQLGLGQKDPSGKEETVVRIGLAYELELQEHWFLKPYLAIDFIDNEENEEVLGVYIGRTF